MFTVYSLSDGEREVFTTRFEWLAFLVVRPVWAVRRLTGVTWDYAESEVA